MFGLRSLDVQKCLETRFLTRRSLRAANYHHHNCHDYRHYYHHHSFCIAVRQAPKKVSFPGSIIFYIMIISFIITMIILMFIVIIIILITIVSIIIIDLNRIRIIMII